MYEARNGGATVVVTEKGTFVNETNAFLTESELAFIMLAARKMGKTLTIRMLYAGMYSDKKRIPETKIVDVNFFKIRKKLERAHPEAPAVFRNVWGRGYVFATPAGSPVLENDSGLPVGHTRWVSARKEEVIQAVRSGSATLEKVLARYHDLSEAEYREWERAYDAHGKQALRTTRTLAYQLA